MNDETLMKALRIAAESEVDNFEVIFGMPTDNKERLVDVIIKHWIEAAQNE